MPSFASSSATLSFGVLRPKIKAESIPAAQAPNTSVPRESPIIMAFVDLGNFFKASKNMVGKGFPK